MELMNYGHIAFFLAFMGYKTTVSGQDFVFRLTDGTTPFDGIVEVLREGVWEHVCDDEFDAGIICNSLGFPGAMMVGDSTSSASPTCESGSTLRIRCNYPGYIGCYKRMTGSDILYTHQDGVIASMSVERCVKVCADLGERFASLFRGKCRCGDVHPTEYADAIYAKVEDSKCDRVCGARSDQICGQTGSNKKIHSIYSTTLGACGGTFHEQTGWILSSGFPGNYNTGVNCLWTVMLEDHYVINVTLRMFDLQDGDVLILKNITGRPAGGISLLSNFMNLGLDETPHHVGVTLHNTLTVRFLSYHDSGAPGFAIFYEAVAVNETRTRQTSTAGITSEPPATTLIETTRSRTTKIQATTLSTSQPSTSYNDSIENATSPSSAAGKASTNQNMSRIIVGGVVGAIAFIAVIVILVWILTWHRRRTERTKRKEQHDNSPSTHLGKSTFENPYDTGVTDLKTPSSNYANIGFDSPLNRGKITDGEPTISGSCSRPCEGAVVVTEEQSSQGEDSEHCTYVNYAIHPRGN
ncbi:kremen protein 1-like [Ptychodera flava]|uniref:kremen protein 1-like n=1 Tax=Ptychodera flava TaxID=63121 RepID=UPI00396A38C6